MARTDVTSTKLSSGGIPPDIADPAGVAVDVTNGMRVVCSKGRNCFVRITNTSAAGKQVTVRRPSTSTKEFDAGLPRGDYLSTAIPATTGVRFLGPFGGGYVQTDGGIYLDFQAGHTGVVTAFEVQ